jgi:hypothetical protein
MNPGSTNTVDGNTQLYGKLYAPDAAQTFIGSNAKVYGAVIAGGLDPGSGGGIIGNGGVSYDEALLSAGGGAPNGANIVSWIH